MDNTWRSAEGQTRLGIVEFIDDIHRKLEEVTQIVLEQDAKKLEALTKLMEAKGGR